MATFLGEGGKAGGGGLCNPANVLYLCVCFPSVGITATCTEKALSQILSLSRGATGDYREQFWDRDSGQLWSSHKQDQQAMWSNRSAGNKLSGISVATLHQSSTCIAIVAWEQSMLAALRHVYGVTDLSPVAAFSGMGVWPSKMEAAASETPSRCHPPTARSPWGMDIARIGGGRGLSVGRCTYVFWRFSLPASPAMQDFSDIAHLWLPPRRPKHSQ